MTNKSHVAMEQNRCIVCAKDFDTGTVLFDRRLQNSLDPTVLTGWGLCPEHQKLYDDGFIALVGADESKSDKLPNGTIKPDGAYRTGEVAQIKFELFEKLVNVSGKDRDGKRIPVMFCDPEVIELLKKNIM